MPDGGRDDDRIEDIFSEIESQWPEFLKRIRSKSALTFSEFSEAATFIVALRVRVPAARDAAELFLAEGVRMTGLIMEANGDLPPPPPGLEEALKIENLTISIDPHRSIHLMMDAIRGLGPIIDMMGYVIVHNETDTPYITSDNPVVYFDPTVSSSSLRPYTISPEGPIMAFFPISSNLLLVGCSQYRESFLRNGITYSEEHDPTSVQKINDLVARFAYRQIYARDASSLELALPFVETSPVPQFDTLPTDDGNILITRMIFGPRPVKPKWRPGRPLNVQGFA